MSTDTHFFLQFCYLVVMCTNQNCVDNIWMRHIQRRKWIYLAAAHSPRCKNAIISNAPNHPSAKSASSSNKYVLLSLGPSFALFPPRFANRSV